MWFSTYLTFNTLTFPSVLSCAEQMGSWRHLFVQRNMCANCRDSLPPPLLLKSLLALKCYFGGNVGGWSGMEGGAEEVCSFTEALKSHTTYVLLNPSSLNLQTWTNEYDRMNSWMLFREKWSEASSTPWTAQSKYTHFSFSVVFILCTKEGNTPSPHFSFWLLVWYHTRK